MNTQPQYRPLIIVPPPKKNRAILSLVITISSVTFRPFIADNPGLVSFVRLNLILFRTVSKINCNSVAYYTLRKMVCHATIVQMRDVVVLSLL